MSAVINHPTASALVDHISDAIVENIETGELSLPTNDDELRVAAAIATNAIIESQRRLSDRFGRFFTSETARSALGSITRQALASRVENNRLLRVETADGKKVYPELQFDGEGSLVQGLPKILQTLLPAAADEWVVLYWLTAPLSTFEGRTAIEVVRTGSPSDRRAILKLAKDDAAVWQDVQHGDIQV